MRIVVTGNAGMIGSHLADHLLKEGHTVFGLDNLSTGLKENISDGIKFYKIDLRKRDMVNFVMKIIHPDIVFHLGAFPHEGLSQFCPNLITENNLNASMNLLVASIREGVKRFVFTSSMSVYGDQVAPFDERYPRDPVDIYGVSKAAFENSLEIMSKVYDFEYSIIRPHNVIGPRQALHDPYRNVVGIFMNRLLQNKAYYIYGDGEQKRAFSFVKDLIPVLARCGFDSASKNQIFNVGADKAYSINELSTLLLKISGKSIKPIYIDDRPQEVDDAWCNNDKAKDVLGFEDSTSLEDGLKEMWAWAQSVGYKEPKYLPFLELVNEKTPSTWTKKLI